MSGAWWQSRINIYEINSMFFYHNPSISRLVSEQKCRWRRQQVSQQRGLKRHVTSWLWPVPVSGRLLWTRMNSSCLMCHFQTRRASGSQAESGGRAGGVSSLYLGLIRPLPVSTPCAQAEPLFRSKSRHEPGSSSNCEASSRPPVKGAVCRGYLEAFGHIKICSGLIRCSFVKLVWIN